MKEVPISRVVYQSEQFKFVSEQQSLASQKLQKQIDLLRIEKSLQSLEPK